MDILEEIKKNINNGNYSLKNIRHSFSICVIDREINHLCNIIVDEIYDSNNKKTYTVERNVGQESNYLTIDIFDNNLESFVYSKYQYLETTEIYTN